MTKSLSEQPRKYAEASREIYDKIVNWYVRSYWDDETDLDWIMLFLRSFSAASRLCDVGSGPGNFARHLKPTFHDVTCIDISTEMILAVKRLLPPVHGIVADMGHIPVADYYFDGLLCAYSMNHIVRANVSTVIREFRRITRSGGVLHLLLKEGDGNYEFTASNVSESKGLMELWRVEALAPILEANGFSVTGVLRKSDLHPSEFNHGKIMIKCQAVDL